MSFIPHNLPPKDYREARTRRASLLRQWAALRALRNMRKPTPTIATPRKNVSRGLPVMTPHTVEIALTITSEAPLSKLAMVTVSVAWMFPSLLKNLMVAGDGFEPSISGVRSRRVNHCTTPLCNTLQLCRRAGSAPQRDYFVLLSYRIFSNFSGSSQKSESKSTSARDSRLLR